MTNRTAFITGASRGIGRACAVALASAGARVAVAARNQAMSAQGPMAKGQAESTLSGALRQLFALSEAYPQLRAAENFAQLQSTLGQIEDTLQNARRYYNAAVRDLNTRVEQFPSNLVAGMGNFKPREFFEISAPAEREVPHVSFSATPTA